MRGPMHCALGLLLLQITLVVASAGSPRLVEKELGVHLPSDDKYLTTGLEKPLRLSGYFKLNRTYDAHMFYFFFEAASEKRHEEPLAVWMTGGPGCSSELAVFYENGPFRINDDLTLDANEFGWDQTHNMIFVDQPINTGFSYSEDERDRVFDEKVVAADMLDFLKEFRAAHPSYFDAPLFITGESYGERELHNNGCAGHYVPSVTFGIYEYNKVAKEPFNLEGFAIGNGLTNPAIQYGSYADFSFANGLISKNMQSTLNALYPVCKFGINACNTLGWDIVCDIALIFCQNTIVAPIQAEGFNVYDIRKPCIGPLCYDFSLLDRYLAQDKVREELGVGDRPWQSCSPDVYNDFLGDIMRNYEDKVSAQLEAGIKVLIYVGTEDWICNWMGNKAWVSSLAWSQREAFDSAETQDWRFDGSVVGSVKSAGPLSFIKVFQAGHMVPMDKPAEALDMITTFTHPQSTQSASASPKRKPNVLRVEKVRANHLLVQ